MGDLTDTLSTHSIQLQNRCTGLDHALMLVQDRMVISIFPGHQVDAALDLARVLCRALSRPVELFRLHRVAAQGVHAGTMPDLNDPSWIRVAQVRPSLVGNITVETCDGQAPSDVCHGQEG